MSTADARVSSGKGADPGTLSVHGLPQASGMSQADSGAANAYFVQGDERSISSPFDLGLVSFTGTASANQSRVSRPLRVLHVYKTFFPDSVGGMEQAISQMVRATQGSGVENRILSISPNPLPKVLGWEGAQHLRFQLTVNLASNAMSFELMREFGKHVAWADVVHYHFPWPFADLLHLTWGVRKPSIVTYHSDIVRQRHWMRLYRWLMFRFLGSVDCIVATSPNYVRTSGVLQRFAAKTRVIPIGLNPGSYPVASPAVLKRWQAAVGRGFFLFIGVIRYYKGLHILIEAAAGTTYPIVIVGAGPIESELRIRANRLGLTNVRFLGALPEEDKVALLTLAGTVVFPSHLRSEAFGVTLLEGAMHGKPLISSEIGTGTSFINVNEETGLVIPPGDPVALRNAMNRLYADEALRDRMGTAARARFDTYFTAEKMGKDYLAAYGALCTDARTAATSQLQKA